MINNTHQQTDTFLTGKIQYLTPREKFEHKQNEDRIVKLHACTIINEYQTNQNYVYINYEVKIHISSHQECLLRISLKFFTDSGSEIKKVK